jgi:diguanylate cyclase (GGDEF)-like protein
MREAKARPRDDDSDTGAAVGVFVPHNDPFYAARNLTTPIWVYDIDFGRIVYANAAACKIWRAKTEVDLIARDLTDGMSTSVAKRLEQHQATFLSGPATFHEMWTFYPNGDPLTSNVAIRGFILPDGRMGMQCEILESGGNQPENLRSAEALLHTDVMIALFELGGRALYMNPMARTAFGEAASDLSALFVKSTDYHVMIFELDGKGEHRMVALAQAEQGERWFDISGKLCNDAVTGKPAVLLTAVDVTELKTTRDHARYLADRDQLTGCYNRAYLQRHFDGLAENLAQSYLLLYFDVDRFKQINDTYGHDAGDAILKELSLRAQDAVGEKDLVFRLGGDEFGIFMHCSDLDDRVTKAVEDVFNRLSGPVKNRSDTILTTVSVGATKFLKSNLYFETALQQADLALYKSKRDGRNGFTLYDEAMGIAAREKAMREKEIKDSLTNRDFLLFFQPRLALSSGKVTSMEALVRWNHPQLGVMPPSEFIPICEETGLIEDLGQQVLELGFEQVLNWHKTGQDMELSLNISPRQFADDTLMTFLHGFSQRAGFPTKKIELEITENVLIGDLDALAKKLTEISSWGYKIAVDDFGTGYSNLSYISRFPLSCLKIDGSFVQQLPQSGPMVQLIIALGKQIGTTIVAEGVETQAQFDFLKSHGCDQIQGYLISRPLPLTDLSNFFPSSKI